MNFYAVRKGRETGVFKTWKECETQIKGFHGAQFKKFATEEEALAFVSGASKRASTSDTKGPPTPPKKQKTDEKSDEKKSDDDESAESSDPGSTTGSEAVVIYIDGAYMRSGKNELGGIGVYWGADDPRNLSEHLGGTQTNNSAEIHAAIRALKQAKEKGVTELTVKSDSQYFVDAASSWIAGWKKNDWKKKSTGEEIKNKDEFIDLDKAMDGLNVTWVHVPSKAGDEGNAAAEQLAKQGAKKPAE